jgi:hypothetical protein
METVHAVDGTVMMKIVQALRDSNLFQKIMQFEKECLRITMKTPRNGNFI